MSEALDRLPELASAHLRMVLLALLFATALALPVGIAARSRAGLSRALLAAAGVVQTIPALALLAAMVPLLSGVGLPGIGVLPAFVALVLYAILPIARSTLSGLRGVDPAVLEAARGVGMTPAQSLRDVELPLALPHIVSGLRTAAMWTVGMATLSTPVGAPGLGDLIFAGLQTRQPALLLVGCGAASSLALALDGAIALLARGAERGSRGGGSAALRSGAAAMAALALFAFVTPMLHGRAEGRPVLIGAKTFTEQLILAELLREVVIDAGASEVEVRGSLGSTIAFDALAAGELDVYVDYSGTLWANVLHREGRPDLEAMAQELRDTHGIEVLASLGFQNAYALAMREADMRAGGLTTLEDLARSARSLRLGVDYELLHRGEWAELVRSYGLSFAETRTMDPALLYEALAAGEVDVASVYTTDGRLAAMHLDTLSDPHGALPPYDALILARRGFTRERPALAAALASLEGRLSALAMRAMNGAVDGEGRAPRAVAREWLATQRAARD